MQSHERTPRASRISFAALQGLVLALAMLSGGCGTRSGGNVEPEPPILLVIQAVPPLPPVPGKQNHMEIQVNQEVQLLAITLGGLQVNDKVQWSQFTETPPGLMGTLNAQTGQFKAPGTTGTIRISAVEKAGSDRQYNGHTYLDIVP